MRFASQQSIFGLLGAGSGSEYPFGQNELLLGLKTCIAKKSRILLSYDPGELKTLWPAKKQIIGSSICFSRSGKGRKFGRESPPADQMCDDAEI